MRLVGVSPLQLVKGDLDVERIEIVLIFVTDELLVTCFGIIQLITGFHIHQPGSLEEITPPGRGMLFAEITLKYVHMLVGCRQVECEYVWRVGKLLSGEFS